MTLVDTHCHLDLDAFDADRAEVLARAEQEGVTTLLIPSIELSSADGVLALAAAHTGVYAAVGMHPNSSTQWDDASGAQLRQLAQHAKVRAIGEIGLDYYWDDAPHDVQRKVLQAQLELAAEMDLPVIVHNREASEELLAILLEWQAGLAAAHSPLAARPGVLHSFSGDQVMAERALAAGFFLGFTGPLTFKNAAAVQAIAQHTPLEQILIETDSPYLSPHPRRGQRNEPARVRLVAEKLAELKGLPFAEVATATSANAQRLFRFEAPQ